MQGSKLRQCGHQRVENTLCKDWVGEEDMGVRGVEGGAHRGEKIFHFENVQRSHAVASLALSIPPLCWR